MNKTILVGALANLLIRLWRHLSLRRRRQFCMLMGLMMVSAVMEIVSLGAVLPFLGILIDPERLFSQPLVAEISLGLGITSAHQLVMPLTLAFAMAALIAGAIRIVLLLFSNRLAYDTSSELSTEVYRRTLYQPYFVHVARNSSELISGITNKLNGVVVVLVSFMTIFSSAVLLVAIIITLMIIDPTVATLAVFGFGASYAFITLIFSRQLYRNSKRIAREQTQLIKALQEGLGGIRDVLLDGTQPVYCDIYRKADSPLRRAQASNAVIGQSPRYIMEALGMVLISILAYALSRQSGGIAAAVPVLGALALGAQRLLPALQQIYSAWAGIAGNHGSLVDAIALLDQPMPAELIQPTSAPIIFQNTIHFQDVRFRYVDNGPWVIDGLNLTIPKGARVGFVGSTGSGKSTTLDLLMGLLIPTEGKLLIDGQLICGSLLSAWQRSIAHVPQNIYLADTTLAENIAFGVPYKEIDMVRVQKAAREAQIEDYIESRPERYHAYVGERGIRLSGGQRQRIGIARALYKQASVLVFDEATSALDNATEQSVMDAIEGLNRQLTILHIAHRFTTVRRCDIIVQLEHGRIVAQGTYEQLLEKKP